MVSRVASRMVSRVASVAGEDEATSISPLQGSELADDPVELQPGAALRQPALRQAWRGQLRR
jgi:hypothetical protein